MTREKLFPIMADKAVEIVTMHPDLDVSITDCAGITGSTSLCISHWDDDTKATSEIIILRPEDDEKTVHDKLSKASHVADMVLYDVEQKRRDLMKKNNQEAYIAELEAKLEVLTKNPRAAV